jgi:hypothetical protein
LANFAVLERNDGIGILVNDVRRFRCGKDPFLPIILASWVPNLGLECGIIDTSANDLSEQIRALVNHRKPSNVTEEYFGPDRRTEEARGDNAGSVEVQNAL